MTLKKVIEWGERVIGPFEDDREARLCFEWKGWEFELHGSNFPGIFSGFDGVKMHDARIRDINGAEDAKKMEHPSVLPEWRLASS